MASSLSIPPIFSTPISPNRPAMSCGVHRPSVVISRTSTGWFQTAMRGPTAVYTWPVTSRDAIREQVDDHGGDVLGIAHLGQLRRDVGRHPGPGHGRDGVGPHAVAVQAHGGGPHQRHDPALGGRVVGLGHTAHVGAGGEPDERPRLLLAHDGRGVTEHREVTLQVCGDDGVPLVLGHVEQHPLAQDAGHGHDPVDPPPPLDGGVHDPLAAGHRAHVLGHGHGLTAGRLDLFDHGLGHLAGGVLARQSDTDVGHHHLGALGRARQRARPGRCRPPTR